MIHQAFSLLTVKSVDDKHRVISGIASTPTVDRVGDIVEPLGARFAVPMPLLLYHNSEKPVGRVEFARPTKDGIPFRASLPNVTEPGVVQDRVNEAYHSLKYLLIGAVSIGFRALENGVELLKSGGLRFKEWEWLELSLCAIPANPDAVIQSFKSLDAARIHSVLGTHASESDIERAAFIKTVELQTRDAIARARKGVVRLDTFPPPSSKTNTTDPRAALGLPRKKGVVRLADPPGASGTTKAEPA